MGVSLFISVNNPKDLTVQGIELYLQIVPRPAGNMGFSTCKVRRVHGGSRRRNLIMSGPGWFYPVSILEIQRLLSPDLHLQDSRKAVLGLVSPIRAWPLSHWTTTLTFVEWCRMLCRSYWCLCFLFTSVSRTMLRQMIQIWGEAMLLGPGHRSCCISHRS